MRHRIPAVLLLASLTASLAAQDRPDRPDARFRVELGVAAGKFNFDSNGSNLDGRTDAGLFRFSLEATSPRGYGGGVRFEGVESDDDLFAGTGFSSSQANHGSIYTHFTYRFEEHRYSMSFRAGLLFDDLTLKDRTNAEVDYTSFGPYFEIAPEVELLRRGKTRWSLYGEFGFGFASTWIDVDNDPNNYDSWTSFWAAEIGTRFTFHTVELGFAYVGRWQTMDQSDPQGGLVALGYNSDFQGLLVTFAVLF
jgi:hypothetical protein